MITTNLSRVLPLWIACLLLVACRPSVPDERACRKRGYLLTERFLDKQRPRYQQAINRAVSYLDTFTIDPLALRRQGMKGRKKLVELLDAYVALHRYASGKRRGEMRERFKRAAEVTRRPEYHDMGKVNDLQFRQDATSYMRACYLMDKMKLDTRAYRAAIRRVKPRLDAHMSRRGPHQRMAFRFYYGHFGMSLPAALQKPFKETLTARRVNPFTMALGHAYDLTHEVFVPFDYGGKLNSDYFSKKDRSYLRRTLEIQTIIRLGERDTDIVGELLASLRYLGDSDLRAYREGLAFVLASQRPNGSFGNYERYRKKRGAKLELDLYLHTTSVAMDILPLAFDGPPVKPE
jgi:hypothetical protein